MILALSGRKIIRLAVKQCGKNALAIVVVAASVALAAVYSLPFLRNLFKIVSLPPAEFGLAATAAIIASLLAAIVRKLWK